MPFYWMISLKIKSTSNYFYLDNLITLILKLHIEQAGFALDTQKNTIYFKENVNQI